MLEPNEPRKKSVPSSSWRWIRVVARAGSLASSNSFSRGAGQRHRAADHQWLQGLCVGAANRGSGEGNRAQSCGQNVTTFHLGLRFWAMLPDASAGCKTRAPGGEIRCLGASLLHRTTGAAIAIDGGWSAA
jgi:hypothetical protein